MTPQHEPEHGASPADFVTYFGDFEDAYRRSDGGDEFGFLVPIALIERREAAERQLDEANTAIQRYIEENGVAEIDLTELK